MPFLGFQTCPFHSTSNRSDGTPSQRAARDPGRPGLGRQVAAQHRADDAQRERGVRPAAASVVRPADPRHRAEATAAGFHAPTFVHAVHLGSLDRPGYHADGRRRLLGPTHPPLWGGIGPRRSEQHLPLGPPGRDGHVGWSARHWAQPARALPRADLHRVPDRRAGAELPGGARSSAPSDYRRGGRASRRHRRADL